MQGLAEFLLVRRSKAARVVRFCSQQRAKLQRGERKRNSNH